MSNDASQDIPQYKTIDQQFKDGVASLKAAKVLKDRNDIPGAKNKLKEAIEKFNRCDTDEAKQKLNEARKLLDDLGG